MTSKVLGESCFTGGYKLEFYNNNATVTAKLFRKGSELGTCPLENLPLSSLTYETLPPLAKTRINQFLSDFGVPLQPERVTILPSTGPETKALSIVPSSLLTNGGFFPSWVTPIEAPSPSNQPSIEVLKKALLQLDYPQKKIEDLLETSSQEENQLLLIDTLFGQIFSSNAISSLDPSILNARDSRGYNLFLAATALGNQEKFKPIFPYYQKAGQLYTKGPQGQTALHIASALGHASLIPLLTDAGFKIDKKDHHGLVPLHWAIHRGDPETVLALLKNGASLKAPWFTPDHVQYYPLEMAIAAGNPDVLQLLLKNDQFQQLNFHQAMQGVGTLIHLTIRTNQTPMLSFLLSNYFDKVKTLLNQQDPEGRTPLQLAAYLGDLYGIRLLHKHGVDLNYGEQEKGGTAVHYAALSEQPNVIRLLDWLGADLQRTDSKGQTPIILLKGKTPSAIECKGLLTNLPKIARSEKTEPPNYTKRPPHNLVIQGGGPRGIAYYGAIEAMEKRGALSELKRVAGTSAGAITAAFLAVGCKSSDLKELLNRNFEEFLDTDDSMQAGLLKGAQNQSPSEAIQALLREYWGGWSTLLHPFKRAELLKDKLHKLTGLAKGEAIRNWIEEIITKQTGKTHCTFGELAELIHQNPQKYKELHVFSIRIGEGPQPDIIRFSHEDPAWNDLIISDAVRASLSIPGVFQPHTLHFKDATGKRHPREHHGQFIDGGLIRNFPIDAFDDEKYQEDRHFRGEKTNRRTLGLSLSDVITSPAQEVQNVSSSSDLLKALVSTYYNAEQILLEETGRYRDRTIVIPIKGIGLLDFNASPEVKDLNINSGRTATDSFFQPPSQKGDSRSQ